MTDTVTVPSSHEHPPQNETIVEDSQNKKEKNEEKTDEQIESICESIKNIEIKENEEEKTEIIEEIEEKKIKVFSERELIKILHQRNQLVGKVHAAVTKSYNSGGIVVDLIIFDHSSISPKIEFTSEILKENLEKYSSILAEDSHKNNLNFPIFTAAVLLPWNKLPYAIRSLPMDCRIKYSMQFLPPQSYFNV